MNGVVAPHPGRGRRIHTYIRGRCARRFSAWKSHRPQ